MNPACVNGKIALANKALDEGQAQQSHQNKDSDPAGMPSW
jgi:hypothetical protein